MASRLNLQQTLQTIMGSNKVYFQPPESIKMTYPCIHYSLARIDTVNADDIKYRNNVAYTLILIDKNPESRYFNSILNLKYCKFDRVYATDGLYHYVFTIYI